jgi:hypothetical protein
MRFAFELADPAHLESLLNSIKRPDSVYDMYRILPGKGGGCFSSREPGCVGAGLGRGAGLGEKYRSASFLDLFVSWPSAARLVRVRVR